MKAIILTGSNGYIGKKVLTFFDNPLVFYQDTCALIECISIYNN